MLKARRVFAALGLAAYAVLHGAGAIWWHTGASRFCAAFWSAALVVGAIALLKPTFWARRYALGISTAGLLNIIAYFAYFRDFGGWCYGLLQGGAFVLITVALLGRGMRAHYDERAPHWHFDHPTMHLLAAALSFNVAGIAMLVYYATLDEAWTTPGLRAGALVIAGVLTVGTLLATTGRIAGLFVMTLGGIASLYLGYAALTQMTTPTVVNGCSLDQLSEEWQRWYAWGRYETVKGLVGFLPAAFGSLLCFGAFVGPMVRFVRNSAQRNDP
jgi:hypothetical protein